MKEGQPKGNETLKKWIIRGGIIAGILGIIAMLAA